MSNPVFAASTIVRAIERPIPTLLGSGTELQIREDWVHQDLPYPQPPLYAAEFPTMIGVATFTISVKASDPAAMIPAEIISSLAVGKYS